MTIYGLIIKPQFDLDKCAPGTAIHILNEGSGTKFYKFNKNALIVSATPLKLTVVYVEDNHKRHLDHESDGGVGNYRVIDIPVKLVNENELIITFLGGK